ncbi:MAG: hypothetical protein UR52_C0021G0002 [Candidatus Gottesmanbacteria bacterium GW2011_GWA1_34_13]|uniref:Methylated-DNA-[protein]-cysteine S-methyltransferase DNA binding domain-containing protein n=1 Tax=Candidatus Gottesmanbacteria bacterium GW2011_GWA1_34_13 TaxID=1618434 RepID=A0A0G0B3K2_9BACT|nr:MAG: hypothetical protein UR52_C0021G0002 [Candidatus Gottesmanbacteria bacterium GW2011_GWA1_34_13]
MKSINSRSTPLVYQFLLQIPKGKVVTYGMIAKQIGCKSARLIGNILHQNPNPQKFPCYKVVNAEGKIAINYAYGGKKEQIKRLKKDGIEVKNDKVNLKKYLWTPKM